MLEFSAADDTITAQDLKRVSGFETIDLGHADLIAVTAGLANSAARQTLAVNCDGADVVNLTAVTSKTDKITVWGANGGDTINAGASLDTFGFSKVGDSTGSAYDLISGANFARDRFDVSDIVASITGINAAVTNGPLSTATFDANLVTDLGAKQLGADHAVLFTASSGTLKGDTFLVVDCNGTACYQAGAELVIRLAGTTGTLTAGNFL